MSSCSYWLLIRFGAEQCCLYLRNLISELMTVFRLTKESEKAVRFDKSAKNRPAVISTGITRPVGLHCVWLTLTRIVFRH